MAEYVAEMVETEHGIRLDGPRERVVRCRDCRYKRGNWNGKRPAAGDWFFCAYFGGCEMTEPDGFCAWGEPR